jgi:hypothetical protein
MPQLFVVSTVTSNFTRSAVTATINGNTCQEYNRHGGPGDVIKLFVTSSGTLCKAVFDDYREFTFIGITPGAQTPGSFTPPQGCKCGQPIDIAVVLDRSGSISQTEFQNQRAFVVGFAGSFAYGPFGANLALIHFNTPAWTTLTMTEGINDANVQTAVDKLECCIDDPDMTKSCCCCGTSVSSGMRLGADQLKLGRPGVEKVLLVISDGYHNHDILGNDCAQQSQACRDDLQAATDYVKRAIPDVKIYSIGVGADRDISMDELLIVADGKNESVMRYTDFTNLAQNSLDLVARACQENLNPCGGCCGFCVCGQCTAPDACDQSNFCQPNAVSGACCKKTPMDCTDPTDKCATYACDATQGKCLATPIACKPSDGCFNYTCAAATGACSTWANPACGNQPECTTHAQCNDGNACTDDLCDFATSACKWTSIAATCNDNNLCTIDECDVAALAGSSPCKYTPVAADFCDDQSNCTIDRCDAALGCVNENVTCADENACTDDFCDPWKGCLHTPKVCQNDGDDKCKIWFCLSGKCEYRNATEGCGANVAIVAATLTTAAIIGIVVGVVLCVAGIGAGGAYAYSQAAGTGSFAPVANNPIYVGSGAQGTNPLYKQ